MILETKRLILRQLTQDDFADLAEILQDKEVVYAYQHEFSDEDVQIWLERQQARYQKYGFGLWAIVLKETGQMIGQAGLTMQPYYDQEILEIGYLLKRTFWHHGYAHEATMGCKKYAYETLKANKVYSVIKADNAASIKVAEGIGMSKEAEFITEYFNGEMLHYLYSINLTK